MKFSTLSVLVATAFVAGCSTTPASDPGPVPESILAMQTCRAYIISEPKITAADFPADAFEGDGRKASVVISYKLDGSGKAVDPRVVYSRPRKLFDKTTLNLLGRTQFAPGAIQKSCAYVRTYATRAVDRMELPVNFGLIPKK